MKYGLYSPKCIEKMYSDRNIEYVNRSQIHNFGKDILYVHIPYVKTDDRSGYMYVMVCKDDVYILCHMKTVKPVIQLSVNNAIIYAHNVFDLDTNCILDDFQCSNDGNVIIGNTYKISINADKLRDYQVIAYDYRFTTPFIPDFKKEYLLSFIIDGDVYFWLSGIILSFMLLGYLII